MQATMSRHETTGEKVKRARRLAGLSQVELAEKAGVSENTIWRLETDRSAIARWSNMRSIAKALNVEVRDLIGE